MLSVEAALQHVLERASVRPPIAGAAADSLGLVLAEAVTSDVDSPPHDKSIVDGYAIVAADLANGPAEFEILEEVTAGDVPHRAVSPGKTARVMTGAPIPEGADAMVMVEQAELRGNKVWLNPQRVTRGQNIMPRAASMSRGETILSPGHVLRAIELGLLSEVGHTRVRVVPRPRVAVLSTGNELVPPELVPAPGQIRNSNSAMLIASTRSAGAESVELGIARDQPDVLKAMIRRGLESDVLVISGGVSAGVLDLVPGVLASLGVQPVFHKVCIKPGKPLWFGVLPAAAGDKLVFGLPGNPVSSLVSFELFVRPAIARLAGREADVPGEEISAKLAQEYVHRGDRPTYAPAVLSWQGGQASVEPLRWRGSGDLRALARANALACFPSGDYSLAAGESVRLRRLR